jgi:hypothetical protein
VTGTKAPRTGGYARGYPLIHLHSGNLEDGSTVAMPVGSIVQWRVVGGHSIFGAWNSYTVVNGGVLNAVPMAYTMTIKAPAGIGVDIALDIGILEDGGTIGLPRNSTIDYRTNSTGSYGPWIPHSVGNCGLLDVTPGPTAPPKWPTAAPGT